MSNMRNNFFFEEEVIGTAEEDKKSRVNSLCFGGVLNNLLCNPSVLYLSRCAATDKHRMWKIKQISKKHLDL